MLVVCLKLSQLHFFVQGDCSIYLRKTYLVSDKNQKGGVFLTLTTLASLCKALLCSHYLPRAGFLAYSNETVITAIIRQPLEHVVRKNAHKHFLGTE